MKVEKLDEFTVLDIVHNPTYFVPGIFFVVDNLLSLFKNLFYTSIANLIIIIELDSDVDSMSVWNLLREFRIRKVHMAVVLNEYGGTIGVCFSSFTELKLPENIL